MAKNKGKTAQTAMSKFQTAVEATPDVAGGYKVGLTALGANSSKIKATDNRLLEGSLDIDHETKKKYPNDNRWDYALSYNGKTYYVEVHPAQTSEVSTMLAKLNWLRKWLREKAPKINALAKAEPAYYWIQSGKCAILNQSRQYRQLRQNNLNPIPSLSL